MADSTIQIDLQLRKEQAEQRLRDFEQRAQKQLERLQAIQARYDRNPNGFTKNQLAASTTAYNNRVKDVQETKKQLENIQLQIDANSAKRTGRLFGLEISKNLEGFAKTFIGGYIGKELVGLGFAAMYTPGGNNRRVREAEAAAEGGITGGAIGAMFGPIGMAVGAVAGSLLGWAKKFIESEKELEGERVGRINSKIKQRYDSGANIQNDAFGRAVEMQGSRAVQMRMLMQRRNQILNGDGPYSVKTLQAQLDKMDDKESNQYKFLQEQFEKKLGEVSNLEGKIYQLTTKPIHKYTDPSSMLDSYAKQGLHSMRLGENTSRFIDSPEMKKYNQLLRDGKIEGVDFKMDDIFKSKPEANVPPITGIDFKALNNPVVGELDKIRRVLEKMAGRGDQTMGIQGTINRGTRMALNSFEM